MHIVRQKKWIKKNKLVQDYVHPHHSLLNTSCLELNSSGQQTVTSLPPQFAPRNQQERRELLSRVSRIYLVPDMYPRDWERRQSFFPQLFPSAPLLWITLCKRPHRSKTGCKSLRYRRHQSPCPFHRPRHHHRCHFCPHRTRSCSRLLPPDRMCPSRWF